MISLGLIYMINYLDVAEAEILEYGDSVKDLADGGRIMVEDIVNARNGKDFRYFPSGSNKIVKIKGIDSVAVDHYLSIFRYTDIFGLPHGKGWLNELPWVLQFLSYMKNIKEMVESFYKIGSYSQDDVDPNSFVGL